MTTSQTPAATTSRLESPTTPPGRYWETPSRRDWSRMRLSAKSASVGCGDAGGSGEVGAAAPAGTRPARTVMASTVDTPSPITARVVVGRGGDQVTVSVTDKGVGCGHFAPPDTDCTSTKTA